MRRGLQGIVVGFDRLRELVIRARRLKLKVVRVYQHLGDGNCSEVDRVDCVNRVDHVNRVNLDRDNRSSLQTDDAEVLAWNCSIHRSPVSVSHKVLIAARASNSQHSRPWDL